MPVTSNPNKSVEYLMLGLLVQNIIVLLAARVVNFYNQQISISDFLITLVAVSNFIFVVIIIYWLSRYVSLHHQVGIQTNILNSMNEAVRLMRSERHDFINHLQSVHGLVITGNNQEAIGYMNELGADYRFNSQLLSITNPTLRVLLQNKKHTADSRSINLKLVVKSRLERLILKPTSITTIFGNLIDNAMDAIDSSNIDQRDITFIVSETDGFYHFIIRDSAPPVDENVASEIFTEGYSSKGDGRGYGLAMVKQAAEKHDGMVSYKDDPKEFVVTIPIEV